MHPPTKYGFNKAALACKGFHGVHIVANPREPLEIGRYIFARLLLGNTELGGEAERRDAVDYPEIDGFSAASHVGGHALYGNAEHFRGCHGVNIEAVAERARQLWNIGDMGK